MEERAHGLEISVVRDKKETSRETDEIKILAVTRIVLLRSTCFVLYVGRPPWMAACREGNEREITTFYLCLRPYKVFR